MAEERNVIDLKGNKFGRLTVLYNSNKRSASYVVWICLCVCGNLIEVDSRSLISNSTKSCGCLQRELAARKRYKHGEAGGHLRTRTRLYGIWSGMKTRCNLFDAKDYKYYGGRGIKVCSEWENNFSSFRSWALANGYQDNLTIDRINHAGDYCPENCQWLTKSENSKKARLQQSEAT